MTMNSRNAVNTNDSCWRCSSATLGECENDGGYETCPGVDDVCYVELRKRSGKPLFVLVEVCLKIGPT